MRKSNKQFFVVSLILLSLVALLITSCGGGSEKINDKQQSVDYPTKSINAICPWSAGGGSDIAFRGFLEYMSKILGKSINVRNITGGNGSIGWAEAASTAADGYNLVLLTVDILTNEATELSPTSYKDFDFINMFTEQPWIVITHKDYGWNTLEDFLDAARTAKANGKKLTIAITGEGGTIHQAGILLSQKTDTQDAFTFVPFGGSSEQIADLLGKHIDAVITNVAGAVGHVQAGTLKILATMGEKRMEMFPEVPTVKECGYDVVSGSWRVVAVPKGVPEPILEKLREAGKQVFDNDEYIKWAKGAGLDPHYRDHDESMELAEKQYTDVVEIMELIQ